MWERDELEALNARLAAMSATEVKPPDGAGAAGAVAPRRFAVVPLAECRADRGGGYIVKGLLGPRDLALIIGQPGAGKSLFGPYLAHAVASGRRAFGRKVRACPVLYIAAEAGADVEGRLAALREAYGRADGLHLIAEPVNLRDLGGPDHAGQREAARAVGAGVIFVDTLAAAFPGLEENEAGPMGGAVRSLTGLGEATDAAVVAVHHSP